MVEMKERENAILEAGERTVCICFAHGCLRSRADLAHLGECFHANGYRTVKRISRASLVIVFLCAFDRFAELKSTRLLAVAARRKHPRAKLIACGCFSNRLETRLVRQLGIITVPPRELTERLLSQFREVSARDVQAPLVSDSHVKAARRAFGRLTTARATLATAAPIPKV